jgi:hypothetical protein
LFLENNVKEKIRIRSFPEFLKKYSFKNFLNKYRLLEIKKVIGLRKVMMKLIDREVLYLTQ